MAIKVTDELRAKSEHGASLFSLKSIKSSDFPSPENLSEVIFQVEKGHRLKGALYFRDGKAVLLIKPVSTAVLKSREQDMAVMSFGWDGKFGSALTFTLMLSGQSSGAFFGRAFVPVTHPNFKDLVSSQLFLGLVSGGRIAKTYKLEWLDPCFEQGFLVSHSRVSDNVPDYPDIEAYYWELFALTNIWDYLLPDEDYLSVGWLDHYRTEVRLGLRYGGPEGREEFERSREIVKGLPEHPKQALELFFDKGLRSAIEYIAVAMDSKEFISQMIEGAEHFSKFQQLTIVPSISGQIFRIFLGSPRLSLCGTRLPWLDKSQNIHFQPIDASGWSRGERKEYWANLERNFKIDRPRYLDADDYPVDPINENKSWEKIKLGCPVAKAEELCNSLLEEAVSNRQWIIPPRALVALELGLFKYAELSEVAGDVFCILRDEEDRYLILIVNPHTQVWANELRHEKEGQSEAIEVEWAIRLTVAALIRDFWVVEERQRAFGRRLIRRKKNRSTDDSFRVVYLPRIQYLSSPDVEKCSSGLEIEARRKHFVRAHFRKVGTPSKAQLQLASLYGLRVDEGYTFVKPHERGGAEREVVYKSRSALQLLFGEKVISEDLKQPDWFEFERDVRDLLVANGFEIQKTSSPGKGDQGLDVVATRKTRGAVQMWAVQCKCYSSKNVGPSVVRELVGSMARKNARGMLVTTTDFTPGAIKEAQEAGILLVNGEAFTMIMNGKTKLIL